MEIRCHCGSKYIVNKKYKLCEKCNHLRLHGETIFDTKNKQNQKYLEKQKENPKKTIKVSKKQVVRTNELSELKKQIRIEAIQDNRYYCWSCDTTNSIALDCSHIISVKHRKDLELDRSNINLFCRECHIDWESLNEEKVKRMKTFEKDLEYIKSKDSTIYQKTLNRLKLNI